MKKLTLKKCISEIRKRHQQLFHTDCLALDRAMILGEWLAQAQRCVRNEKRNWTEFIASTFNGNPSYDTCQRYLDLHRYSADLRRAEIKLLTDAYEFVKSRKQESKANTTPTPSLPATAPAAASSRPQATDNVGTGDSDSDTGNLQPTFRSEIVPGSAIQPVIIGAASLFCCDMMDAPVEDNSLDAVICDPPYVKPALEVWKQLASFSARKLKPGAVLLAMAGTYHLPSVLENLRCEGLHYYWTMCYEMEKGADCNWSGNGRQVHTYWKPVLWYVKGGYEGKYLKSDKYADQLSTKRLGKSYHKWGQSLPFFQHLVQHFTEDNDLVCDPCMGGGTTGVASLSLQRRFLGIDVDADAMETTSARIRQCESESKAEQVSETEHLICRTE
jgi:hypothetical protein